MIFALFMLGAGGALAAFVFAAMAVAQRERESDAAPPVVPARDTIAASLLYHVVVTGGVGNDEAMRQVRRGTGLAAAVTRGIDVTNWAESYSRVSTEQQRASLLESAVQLVAARSRPVPLRQYAALLDLSFGLGFRTDALARLRQSYGFEYIDHAKDGRTRGARVPEPPFTRDARGRTELLALLGVPAHASRQELTAAYRRLVNQHHPDRFHGATAEVRSAAAARFIEITRAYEELLLTGRD